MVCAPMNLWYIAFTQYPNRYLYPTFSKSDSYHIRYSLFVSVTKTIRIRLCIQTIFVSEFESERNMKTNIILVISVHIQSVFIPTYVCTHNIKLYQMDVKSAFLNGYINEEVYVEQPPSFEDDKKPNHVYKYTWAMGRPGPARHDNGPARHVT